MNKPITVEELSQSIQAAYDRGFKEASLTFEHRIAVLEAESEDYLENLGKQVGRVVAANNIAYDTARDHQRLEVENARLLEGLEKAWKALARPWGTHITLVEDALGAIAEALGTTTVQGNQLGKGQAAVPVEAARGVLEACPFHGSFVVYSGHCAVCETTKATAQVTCKECGRAGNMMASGYCSSQCADKHDLVPENVQLTKAAERISQLEEALKRYSGKRLHVVEGRCRLAYHDGEDSPGLWFHEGETWLLGDEAEAALKGTRQVTQAKPEIAPTVIQRVADGSEGTVASGTSRETPDSPNAIGATVPSKSPREWTLSVRQDGEVRGAGNATKADVGAYYSDNESVRVREVTVQECEHWDTSNTRGELACVDCGSVKKTRTEATAKGVDEK